MRTPIVVAAAVLVVAGCGGSAESSGPPRLSEQQFRTQADAICRDVQARAAALEPPRSLDFFPAYADKLLPIVDDGNRRLSELRPPEALEDRAREWTDAREERRDALAELREAALESNQARFDEVREEGDAADGRADRIARELGLETCGAR